MTDFDLMAKRLDRAFELAYFIHGDAEIARQIAFNAMRKLEVTSNAQFKRYYYTPQARKSRNKVVMNDLQLLQRLVYVESEPFELEKEFTEKATENELLIYFVKHLIRITLKRNSFYVTLGLSRILHNYGTVETMEIYNILTQDPEKVQDDCYYRARKKVLMSELKNRFGERLEIAQLKKGEQRFQTAEISPEQTKLVEKCLQTFIPWNTKCSFPEKFNPFSETISALTFDGNNPDDEHRVELNRMHVVLNPQTFRRLVNALHFPLPEEKLEIPKFNMKKKSGSSSSDDDFNPPPKLGNTDHERLKQILDQDAEQRKATIGGVLRVMVDGKQRGLFDTTTQNSFGFDLNEEVDEFIEVYSVDNGVDTLLAAYLLGGEDELQETAITLEGGQKVTFNFAGNKCHLSFEQTSWSRKFAAWWQANTAILRPVFASLALILLGLLGFLVYQNLNQQTPQVAKQNEATITNSNESVNAAPTVETPKVVPTPLEKPTVAANKKPKQIEPKPTLKKEAEKPQPIEKRKTAPLEKKEIVPRVVPKTAPNESVEVAEVQRFAVTETAGEPGEVINTRNLKQRAKEFQSIKNVYLEISGDEQASVAIRQKLSANTRFTMVNEIEKADGLLKISVQTKNNKANATVRMVNAKGNIVYPNRPKTSAWKYVGNIEKVSNQIVKDLAGQK